MITTDRRRRLAPPPGPGDDVCLDDVEGVVAVVVGVVADGEGGGGVNGGGTKRQDFSGAVPKTLTNSFPPSGSELAATGDRLLRTSPVLEEAGLLPRDDEGAALKLTEF